MQIKRKRKFKTKRAVTGKSLSRFFHNWDKWKEGDYVIGEYERFITDTYQNKCPIVKVIEANLSSDVTDKEGNVVDIVGQNLQLNGAGAIKYAFFAEDEAKDKWPIEKGEIVQVLYNGKMEAEDWKGQGQPPHQMEIDVLEDEEEEDVLEDEEEEDEELKEDEEEEDEDEEEIL
jgi:hypothetical protein